MKELDRMIGDLIGTRRKRRPRDSQRAKVYKWENSLNPHVFREQYTKAQAEALVHKLWHAERARYGHGRKPAPELREGGRGAVAYPQSHRLSLGRWARNDWVIAHEVTHCLAYPEQRGHGPRFVAILMGVLARHFAQDIDELTGAALDMGVKFDLRSIGAVPHTNLSTKMLKHLPGTAIELAVACDCTYRQILGAALSLLADGRVKRKGKTLLLAGNYV